VERRYFGSISPARGIVVEIYRCPKNNKSLFDLDQQVERIRANGKWEPDEAGLRGIYNEMLQGWFDEKTDEISEEEAEAMIELWHKEGWPGRS
jgi:PKHD-type hydroxylase C-terminal domain